MRKGKEQPILTTNGMQIPEEAIERIARCVLPEIQRYYASEEGQRAFAAWSAAHTASSADKKDERA